jgi:hypothetical protein
VRSSGRKTRAFAFFALAALGLLTAALVTAGSGFGAAARADDGTTTGDTTTVGSAPVNSSVPVISGEARQGTPFSASDGSWDNSPDAFTYQWRRCGSGGGRCSNISGVSSNSYVARAADVSHTIRVVVTASNSYGFSSATSARTAVVLSETTPPASWPGLGCLGYSTTGGSNIVCNYNMEQPFLIAGTINGPGTLTYKVQCQNKGKVKPKVLFSRSKRVKKGRFKVRGVKAAEKASLRCKGGIEKGPALTMTLRLRRGASNGNLSIKFDGTMPWGK